METAPMMQTSRMTEPPSMEAVVKVAPVGDLGDILVSAEGLALYQRAQEQPGEIKCTEQCAVVWPPLVLATDASVPDHVSGVQSERLRTQVARSIAKDE